MASPTASLDHVAPADWHKVYEPAEDSWLLSDAVCGDAAAWLARAALVLELGSGSGAVSASVLLFLRQQRRDAVCVAADLSPHACRVTAATAAANGVGARLDAVQCDLLAGLRARLRGAVDLFLFNPPYVPTPASEVPPPGAFCGGGSGGAAEDLDTLPAAWAGGENGRQVIDRALPLLPELLRRPRAGDEGDAGGAAYLLLLEDNEPADIAARLAALGLRTAVVGRRQAPCESLLVMRVQWAQQGS
jgi:release factor glutamine methyltransferase